MTRRENEIIETAKEIYNPSTGTPTSLPLRIGFIEGAKWADKTMIDKACEWLKEHGGDFGVPESESGRVYVDDLVCEFREAMEE